MKFILENTQDYQESINDNISRVCSTNQELIRSQDTSRVIDIVGKKVSKITQIEDYEMIGNIFKSIFIEDREELGVKEYQTLITFLNNTTTRQNIDELIKKLEFKGTFSQINLLQNIINSESLYEDLNTYLQIISSKDDKIKILKYSDYLEYGNLLNNFQTNAFFNIKNTDGTNSIMYFSSENMKISKSYNYNTIIQDFDQDGLAVFEDKNKNLLIVKRDINTLEVKEISKSVYTELNTNFDKNGFARASKKTGNGFVYRNNDNQKIEDASSFTYTEIGEFDNEGLALAKKKTGYVFIFIDKQTNKITENSKANYLEIGEFDSDNFAIAKKTKGKGFLYKDPITKEITEISSFEYSDIGNFDENGFAIVSNMQGKGYVYKDLNSHSIKVISDWNYTRLSQIDQNNLIIAGKGPFEGVLHIDISKDEKEAIELTGINYTEISQFRNGVAVAKKSSKEVGFLYFNGNTNTIKEIGNYHYSDETKELQEIGDFTYEEIVYNQEIGFYIVKKGGFYMIIDVGYGSIHEKSRYFENEPNFKRNRNFLYSIDKNSKISNNTIITIVKNTDINPQNYDLGFENIKNITQIILGDEYSEVEKIDDNGVIICKKSSGWGIIRINSSNEIEELSFFDLKSKDEIICLGTKYYKKGLFMNSEIYNHDSGKKEISWPKTKK